MDGAQFDALARALGDARSRRAVLSGLLAGTLGMLGWATTQDTAAKNCKKIKNKAKRKKCLAQAKDATPPPSCADGQRLCGGACIPSNQCCADGDCRGGNVCRNGACRCPDLLKDCGDGICRQCCVAADCVDPEGEPVAEVPVCAAGGTCTCPATSQYCPVSRECGACCQDSQCPAGANCIKIGAGFMRRCLCDVGLRLCTASGQSGCIPNTPTCVATCGLPCNPQDDTPCSCNATLECLFNAADREYYCAPR
jgi:hypothetical protein